MDTTFLAGDTLKVLEVTKNEYISGDLSNYIFLILGWLLGLLGTYIIDHLKKRTKKKEVKKGIMNEIKRIRAILVGNAVSLTMKFGNYNKAIISLIYENIDDFSDEIGFEKFKELIEKYIQLDDEQLKLISTNYQNTKTTDAVNLKSVKHPYIDANISLISLFDQKFQRFITRFIASINQFNEEIYQSRFYYEKTFDISIGKENHKIIQANLLDSYNLISKKSVEIVSLINQYALKI